MKSTTDSFNGSSLGMDEAVSMATCQLEAAKLIASSKFGSEQPEIVAALVYAIAINYQTLGHRK